VSERVELYVEGVPHGRPRPRGRAVRTKGGKWVAQFYQPKNPSRRGGKGDKAWARANAWFKAVRRACFQRMPATPWDGPVSLTIDAYFERPKRLCRRSDPEGPLRHTAKPDRDNVDKAILDALKEAGLFGDDSQVCDGPVRKWYAAKGCRPGVIIVAARILPPYTELSLPVGPAA
jgi:Holliday junction resolvase RusA-like endonuclease